MDAISRVWYNGSYTIAAKPIKTLELHYTMIQFLIIKQLLDSVFVISGIIKVSVSVISLSPRPRLITLTSTLVDNSLHLDNKDNSLHLGRKYARIFVLGHYLFLVAHSFPRATLSENCSLLGTDNVFGQISEHIFAPNGGYCLCIFTGQCRAIHRETCCGQL